MRTYFRVSIFALGDLGGGHWEEDVVVNGPTPSVAYNKALEYLRAKGFAFGSKIEVCDKDGEPFQ